MTKLCDDWFDNPLKNPKTGRTISVKGKIFKQYKKECGEPNMENINKLGEYNRVWKFYLKLIDFNEVDEINDKIIKKYFKLEKLPDFIRKDKKMHDVVDVVINKVYGVWCKSGYTRRINEIFKYIMINGHPDIEGMKKDQKRKENKEKREKKAEKDKAEGKESKKREKKVKTKDEQEKETFERNWRKTKQHKNNAPIEGMKDLYEHYYKVIQKLKFPIYKEEVMVKHFNPDTLPPNIKELLKNNELKTLANRVLFRMSKYFLLDKEGYIQELNSIFKYDPYRSSYNNTAYQQEMPKQKEKVSPAKLKKIKELYEFYKGIESFPMNRKKVLLTFHPDKLPIQIKELIKDSTLNIIASRVFDAMLQQKTLYVEEYTGILDSIFKQYI